MSDHWEYYPCQMGDDRAFTFYDHGIRERINDLDLPNALRVRVDFRQPTPAGLPTNAEFADLSRLEDLLGEAIDRAEGVYVGRITVAGSRHFHAFVSIDEEAAGQLVRQLQADSGYELAFFVEPDPEKKAYWEELFPTADDWQVIQDLKVLDRLEEQGDDPAVPRRIDHWLYFQNQDQRDDFADWAIAEGFQVESKSDPAGESNQYGLCIFHTARTQLEEITSKTILLSRTAREHGGEYDGWGTLVSATEN